MGTDMKTFTRILLAVLVAAACPVYGQSGPFLKYGPVAGIQKSTGTTYQNTAAVQSDVVTLLNTGFTLGGATGGSQGVGTINATGLFINGAPVGISGSGVSSVGLTAPSVFGVTGSPVTAAGSLGLTFATGQTANSFLGTPNGTTGALGLRTLVGADVPPINLGSTANGGVSSASILLGTNGGTSNGFFSVTGPATALKTFTFPNASATVLTTNAAVTVAQGGTGVGTLPAHGVLLGEGTSNVGNVAAMAVDTLLQGQGATSDPAAVSVPNCGSGTTALGYSTSTHAFGCQTISTGSGTVTSITAGTGISASPGNPLTTSGTLTVDQTFAPTMTGLWNFTHTGSTGPAPITINSSLDMITLAGTRTRGNGGNYMLLTDPTGQKGCIGFCSSGSDDFYFENDLASSTHIYSNGIDRIGLDPNGGIFMNQPTGGTVNTLLINLPVGEYGLLVGSNSITTGNSFGEEIQAGTNTSDVALAVLNQGATTLYMKINGAGSMTLGTPTGGGQGVGTLNATGLFVNGVAASTAGTATANTWTAKQTFTAAATTQAVVVNGTANAYSTLINGSSTSGQSFGLLTRAGTNSSDGAMLVQNQAGTTTYAAIDGAGSMTLGTPTGGGQGVGTLNATNLFINGVAVGGAEPCAANFAGTSVSFALHCGTTSVTNPSTGSYVFSHGLGTASIVATCTAAAGAAVVCTATPFSTSGVTVNTYTSTTGIAVNASAVSISIVH